MPPSILVMKKKKKKRPKNHIKILDTIRTVRSKLVIPFKRMGVIVALQQSIKKTLNKLLPITLPMAISGFFFSAATIDVAS